MYKKKGKHSSSRKSQKKAMNGQISFEGGSHNTVEKIGIGLTGNGNGAYPPRNQYDENEEPTVNSWGVVAHSKNYNVGNSLGKAQSSYGMQEAHSRTAQNKLNGSNLTSPSFQP